VTGPSGGAGSAGERGGGMALSRVELAPPGVGLAPPGVGLAPPQGGPARPRAGPGPPSAMPGPPGARSGQGAGSAIRGDGESRSAWSSKDGPAAGSGSRDGSATASGNGPCRVGCGPGRRCGTFLCWPGITGTGRAGEGSVGAGWAGAGWAGAGSAGKGGSRDWPGGSGAGSGNCGEGVRMRDVVPPRGDISPASPTPNHRWFGSSTQVGVRNEPLTATPAASPRRPQEGGLLRLVGPMRLRGAARGCAGRRGAARGSRQGRRRGWRRPPAVNPRLAGGRTT
jgi:hypothetical protein